MNALARGGPRGEGAPAAVRRAVGRKKAFLFDLDGVFYRGKETRVPLGGARTIDAIRSAGKSFLILTNDSTDTREMVRSRLADSGVSVAADEILSSAFLTADYLKSKYGSVTYYLIGEVGLEAELERLGHRRTRGESADFVVVGLDRGLSYGSLDHAARVGRGGARIVATHTARLYMYKDGPAVATGPIVKALEYATGKRAVVMGKPSPLMFKMALARAGCRPDDAVMVGDQVETDIKGAERAGIDAILVTTGVDKSPGSHRVLATIGGIDELAGWILPRQP